MSSSLDRASLINLITVGVVAISPVVAHYLLLFLPPTALLPFSVVGTGKAAAVFFLRAAVLFETKPQMGLFKAFKGPPPPATTGNITPK